MRRWKNRALLLAVCLALSGAASGCSAEDSENTVTIIDGDFAEMKFFTQAARILIEENTSLNVRVQDSMASSLAFEQIRDGKMDIYMSYDGSLLTAYLGEDPADVPEGMSLYEYASRQGQEKANVMLTPMLGEENTYVVAVNREVAEKYNLHCISDLQACAPSLVFAAEHEFFDEGSTHYEALTDFYGLSFRDSTTIDRGLKYLGMSLGNMDATVVYTTDGLNLRFDLVLLEDDRNFFPEYNGAYLIRADLYEDYPELEGIFDSLAGKFSNEICTELNYRIDVENEDPYDVAYEFLDENGFLE